MSKTTAATLREGERYQLGEELIWWKRKPGEGRRITLYVRSDQLRVVSHIDREAESEQNEGQAD